MAKSLVIANWKMYINSPEEAKRYVQGLKRRMKNSSTAEAWIAAPALFIPFISKSGIKIGAQTVSAHAEGAYTGEVSAGMLSEAGTHFALVGHSERRATGESDAVVHAQLVRAAEAALTPVLCVGESERNQDGAQFTHLERQLTEALRGSQSLVRKLIVAYEPVWAIGHSAQDAMKPHELEETVIFIKKILADILGRKEALKVLILYGGSVEPENAARLIADGGVNGFLVGHAAAKLDSFVEILKACQK